jgi:hypothetical protein
MKTRLATLFFAVAAPALFAQDLAPAPAAPDATPASLPAETPAGASQMTDAVATPAAPDVVPAAETSGTTSSMTLSGTAAQNAGAEGSLFSEPNLEITEPDMSAIDTLPPQGEDQMPAGGPTFRKTKTSEVAEEMKQRVRVRQAKTRAITDPKVQEALERADAAQTLPERRKALIDYYNALYDRMVKIDPSVKKSVEELRKHNIGDLDDERIGLAKKSRPVRR